MQTAHRTELSKHQSRPQRRHQSQLTDVRAAAGSHRWRPTYHHICVWEHQRRKTSLWEAATRCLKARRCACTRQQKEINKSRQSQRKAMSLTLTPGWHLAFTKIWYLTEMQLAFTTEEEPKGEVGPVIHVTLNLSPLYVSVRDKRTIKMCFFFMYSGNVKKNK